MYSITIYSAASASRALSFKLFSAHLRSPSPAIDCTARVCFAHDGANQFSDDAATSGRDRRTLERQGRRAPGRRVDGDRVARHQLADQVDAKTRRLVRDAVAKLRYVPHGAARALRSHRSQMVGAVVPSFDYALYARTTSAMQAVLDAQRLLARAGRASLRPEGRAAHHASSWSGTASTRSCSSACITIRRCSRCSKTTAGPTC